MNRCPLIVIGLLVLVGIAASASPALAGVVEDAAAATARARALLRQAIDQSRRADDNLRQLNDQQNAARAQQNALSRQLIQLKQQKLDLTKRSADAQAALPVLEKQLVAAKQAVDQAAPPLAAAKKQHEQDQADVDAVRRKALGAFHDTQSYQRDIAAVKAGQEAVDTATTITINRLEATEDYRVAMKNYEDAQAELEKLKTVLPLGHPRIVVASQKMIDTDSTVRRLRTDTLAHDQSINDAKKQLAVAEADLRDLEADFEKRLVLRPDMIAATSQADKSRLLLAVAQSAWEKAAAAQADTDAKVKSAQNDIDATKAQLTDNEAAIARSQQQVAQLSAQIELMRKQVTIAELESRDTAQRVEEAQRVYDQASANERRIRAQHP